MGMLMYEDMKVSVLQLLLVRKNCHERWGGSSLLFHIYKTDIKGVLLGRGARKNLLSVEKSGVAAS